ncbi:hypothetical protein CVU37_11020 [candidate division BRC1 bacterium HGW-BRC1-1]|nr:MAG: hypothetical protein CVU37_11020 [candidate division BRC1 bacterium HGW-BRC1-1]
MKILIAAGGTGGHIFPAIALGEALACYYPETRFDYLCGERPLELGLYEKQGIKPIVLPARQLGNGIVSRARGWLAAAANTGRAFRLIRNEQYDVIIGMGGYVTGPAVLAGIFARRATAIHEANSVPGRTNRILAPLVSLATVHFETTGKYWKARRTVRVGMPLRKQVFEGERAEAMQQLRLDPARRTLLVVGGSQGARFLYENLMDALPSLDTPDHSDVQLLWSTGAANFEMLNDRLKGLPLKHLSVLLQPFIDRMDLALAAADFAVARSGASAGAELVSCGIPTLFIPFPHAIYDHQTTNASEFVAAGGGEMVAEKDLTPVVFAERISKLLGDSRSEKRGQVVSSLDSRDAAQRLAELLHQLA